MRGLRDVNKRRSIFNFHRTRADYICLQETHSTECDENIWKNEWGGEILFSHGTSNARGTCILINKKFKTTVSNVFQDQAGRIVGCNVSCDGKVYCLCNIYAPNQDNPAFYLEVFKILETGSANKIVVGDYNLVLDNDLDQVGSYHGRSRSLAILKAGMEEFLLEDVWRIFNPDKKHYSWYRTKPKLSASRIDFALVSQGIVDTCENAFYFTGMYTDYSAYYLAIEAQHLVRGRGYWKFNVSHLRNKDYLDLMNEFIDQFMETHRDTPIFQKWELFKYQVRKKSKAYAVNRAQMNDLIIAQLSEKVTLMEENLADTQNNESQLRILTNTKIDLEEFQQQKTNGLMFQSKAKYYEFGEKSSKYFYGLESACYEAKTCHSLIDGQGICITDPKRILELQRDFYSVLYTSDSKVKFDNDVVMELKVRDEIWEMQQQTISKQEVATAVKQLSSQKSPILDGISINWYKVFFSKIRCMLHAVILECYERRQLYDSALLGVISLIPKASKDTRYLKNLCPINLLNSDYKVMEKIIANRMEPALDFIIHSDQKGILKNRRISCNIRKIFDLMTYCDQKCYEALVLSLDFEKCFDKLEKQAIIGSMKCFNFAPYLIEWTDILYKGFQANVLNNGHFSKRFKVNQGVHQGGPASSLYFVSWAELLAIAMRQDKEIQGIPVLEIINLLGQ